MLLHTSKGFSSIFNKGSPYLPLTELIHTLIAEDMDWQHRSNMTTRLLLTRQPSRFGNRLQSSSQSNGTKTYGVSLNIYKMRDGTKMSNSTSRCKQLRGGRSNCHQGQRPLDAKQALGVMLHKQGSEVWNKVFLQSSYPVASSTYPTGIQTVLHIVPSLGSSEVWFMQTNGLILRTSSNQSKNPLEDCLNIRCCTSTHGSNGISAWAIKRQIGWVREPFSRTSKSTAKTIQTTKRRMHPREMVHKVIRTNKRFTSDP